MVLFSTFVFLTYGLIGQSVNVEINRTVKKYIGDVSTLDRSKYFNIHSNSIDLEHSTLYSNHTVGRGRGFWGPFSFARNKTGEVGVYPEFKDGTDDLKSVARFISTEHPYNTFLEDMDVEKAAEWTAEYFKDFVDESGRPEFFEPMNEPFVHAHEFYSGGWNSAKNTEMKMQMSELFAAIGKKFDETPALADIKVIGYSAAWPSMELDDFEHWEDNMKMFMDIAGEYMDAFATHLYDGINVEGQDNIRSGSNTEAILDLIETYSMLKWGEVKPHAISEYGGIEKGYGDDYSDLASIQSIRSINHMLFSLLDREDRMEISIPFITGKALWHINEANNYQPYQAVLWKPFNIGQPNPFGWEYTPRIHFYDLWQNVKGERVHIKSNNPDIQTQAFIDNNTLHVALSNLHDLEKEVSLKLWAGTEGLQEVNIRSLKIFPLELPIYEEITQQEVLEKITLIPGETAVISFTFNDDIITSEEIRLKNYYSPNYIQSITANNTLTYNFDGVETSSGGFATIRMSIARKHDRSKSPIVTLNGNAVFVPGNWKGYDQASRDDFFGMIEIPIPIALINTQNEISITFPDSGGQISSVVLAVENTALALDVKEEDVVKTFRITPNPVDDVLFMDLENGEYNISIFDNSGQLIKEIKKFSPVHSRAVEVETFPSGLYHVRASSQTARWSGKFVKY